ASRGQGAARRAGRTRGTGGTLGRGPAGFPRSSRVLWRVAAVGAIGTEALPVRGGGGRAGGGRRVRQRTAGRPGGRAGGRGPERRGPGHTRRTAASAASSLPAGGSSPGTAPLGVVPAATAGSGATPLDGTLLVAGTSKVGGPSPWCGTLVPLV